jgi:hypothetical protein
MIRKQKELDVEGINHFLKKTAPSAYRLTYTLDDSRDLQVARKLLKNLMKAKNYHKGTV